MFANKEKFETLTPREKKYAKIILSGNNLLLLGRPGVGKSSILKSIAEKLGLRLLKINTPSIDENYVSSFPVPDPQSKRVHYCVPSWIEELNENTLVVFEEITRAPMHVRNPLLSFITEKQILGVRFNCLIAATGNTPDHDPDVEEIPYALLSRFITVEHDEVSVEEIKDFLHVDVYEFLKSDEKYLFYDKLNPRTWENFSKFYAHNPSDYDMFAHFIGEVANLFIAFLEKRKGTIVEQVESLIESIKNNPEKIDIQKVKTIFESKELTNEMRFALVDALLSIPVFLLTDEIVKLVKEQKKKSKGSK